MKTFSARAASLPLLALSACLAGSVTEASSATLFELLFKNNQHNRQVARPPAPAPAPVARRPAAPAKISAPSYYNYKADSLKRVDFAPLAAIAQSASLEGLPAATGFREAVAGLDGFELLAEADAAKAVVAYYQENPDFIWVTGDGISDRAREVVRVLGEAASHGLMPVDYNVAIPSTAGAALDAAAHRDELIRFEMALSARVLRYVSDAERGRVNPNRISGYHDFPAKPLDMVAALKSLAAAPDARAWLEARHPQGAEYKALRVELEALRASAESEIVVDPKLLLKPGESNPELAKILHLIARDLDDDMGGEYGELLARVSGTEVYGEEIVPVIKAAQTKAGLKDDGVIGPRTVQALAGTSKAERIDKVLIALEQLRWLPAELGATRVFINQPAYSATYTEDGQERLNMRVVIGTKANQTTFFYDEIEQVDYNPYWGVPQSILVNEMLPRLRSDPGYLDRAGYEVTDASGRRVPSSSVDWGAYGARVPYNVRQTPSEANALGELKILFPNKHAIYMHDTPQKELFKRDTRAFSHGCVRLADPRGMAAAVLGTGIDHVEAKLAQGHSMEKVNRKIPVYVAYFTAWPNKDGEVEYFADVYDRDARLDLAMEKTEAVRAPAS